MNSEEKLLFLRAKELMPNLHLFSLFKTMKELPQGSNWGACYSYNSLKYLESLLKCSVNINVW